MNHYEGRMQAFQLAAPAKLVPVAVPVPGELAPDMVEVRLELAGICGSDKPGFINGRNPAGQRPVGFPLHECAGTVVRSPGDQSLIGKHVIAVPHHDCGLSELFYAPVIKTHVLRHSLPLQTAILAQPLATVLAALDRLGGVKEARAAVLGLGPIGLTFGYVLREMGVASLSGFDRHDRASAPFASCFDSIQQSVDPGAEFDLVVEAAGHDQQIVNTAIDAAAHRGTVLIFGVPQDDVYAVNFTTFFRKCLVLVANVQPDWQAYLPRAEEYLSTHPDLGKLGTDVFPVDQSQAAFEAAFMRQDPGRGKVLISAEAWAQPDSGS